jgi:glucose-6-phosphate 1-epimerase
MTNTGSSPFRFEAALHTYFRIGDIAQARVHGLDGVSYLDKTDGNQQKQQRGDVTIAKETDSVYLDTAGTVELHDPAMRRRIGIAKENSRTTVVWNPWADKTKAMSDLGDDEWKQMICIECANTGNAAVDLAPGQQHSMKAIASVTKI